ncbi:MAG: cytochrome c family protein [Planctomycetes bacterium]|nr:cytochrome c family protein [Planctomycetota bacterium]
MQPFLKSTFYISTAAAAAALLFPYCSKQQKPGDAPTSASAPAQSSAATPPAIPQPVELLKKPDAPGVHFILIGSHQGELEPCGCSGGQLGGLGRMKTKLEAMVQGDPTTIVIDAGELIKSHSLDGLNAIGEGAAAILKMESTRGEVAAGIFQEMPISVVGLGPRDLFDGRDESNLRAALMSMPGDTARFPTILRRNVLCNGAVGDSVSTSALITTKGAGGAPVSVFVTSLIDQGRVDMKNPAESLHDELVKNGGKYRLSVVIFHGFRDRAAAYAAAIPEVDLWLVAPGTGSADDRAFAAGGGFLVHAGDRGRSIVKLTIGRSGGKTSVENYESPLVSANDPNDKGVQEKIDGYRTKLGAANLVDLLKSKRRVDPSLRAYAGSEACKECHKSAYEVWEKSKHAHALESLKERNGIVDPECIQCHVTGWQFDPPAGEVGTYRGEGIGSKLSFVSCESCHGPALKHKDAPLIFKPQRDVVCEKCHDHDNSPNFDRAKYWPKIAHKKDPAPIDKK